MNYDNPRDLPGFKKKSFSLPFGGGEIWFEHLDGIYENSELVLEKLIGDCTKFNRPSVTSVICFVLNETKITSEIILAISDCLIKAPKAFSRVCFIGANRKVEIALKSALKGGKFALAFINDFEKAKRWLI